MRHLLILLGLTAAAELRVERLFGPETPTGPYKHPASICVLDNGDLYLVWYGGEGEYANSTAIWASRRTEGGGAWSAPKKVAQDPLRSLGNGVAWQAPDGTLWLFYVVRFGETWGSSRVAVKLSGDRGETWSDSTMLVLDEGWMVRGKPIVLSSGEWLLPLYQETGTGRERVPPDTASVFLLRNPKTGEWTRGGRIRSKNGNLQPAPVEVSPGRLIAFCRRGGGYGPGERGYIVRSESRDGGRSWSEGVDSEFPNPNSAVDLIKLASGALLLVYNDSMSERTPLVAALSTDGGKKFPRRLTLAAGKDSFAYPSAAQAAGGTIYVVFTSDNRKAIRLASFREEDVKGAGR
ncbi:MAG: exo-alpha-sialidase [Bryobacteraceae bacterium]|nr:exo-alpha-sialidase [Bryobacteraceae bacterium]